MHLPVFNVANSNSFQLWSYTNTQMMTESQSDKHLEKGKRRFTHNPRSVWWGIRLKPFHNKLESRKKDFGCRVYQKWGKEKMHKPESNYLHKLCINLHPQDLIPRQKLLLTGSNLICSTQLLSVHHFQDRQLLQPPHQNNSMNRKLSGTFHIREKKLTYPSFLFYFPYCTRKDVLSLHRN